VTRYLWDRAFGLPQLALERDGADDLQRSYRYGLGRLTLTDAAGTTHYHHDGLGSVSDLTGAVGESLGWSEYYPYGDVRLAGYGTGGPAVQPFRFTGEQLYSVTGLYHLRARQYDPTTGRFLSTDPVEPFIADPYVASYVYVRGNPIRWADPNGACLPFCAIAAVLGAPAVLEAAAAAVVVTVAVGGAVVGGMWAGHELARGKQTYPESQPKWDPRPDPATQKAADRLNDSLMRLGKRDGPGPQIPGTGFCARHRNMCRAVIVGLLGVGVATGALIFGADLVAGSEGRPYRNNGTFK
jgi:RHS repeat-associated protein